MSDTSQPKVIVYSTTWCAFCKTEKQWLDHLNIPYVEKDIEKDAKAHKELLDKIGGDFKGVPVTDIAGDIILGFDRPSLQASIEKHAIQPNK